MGYALVDEDVLNGLVRDVKTLTHEVIELKFKINPEPDPNELWTAQMIVKAGGGCYRRVIEKISSKKVKAHKKDGKIAVRYQDLKTLGITVNPFELK